MLNEKIEQLLKITDEELFHEKDFNKASLSSDSIKKDVNYLKEILHGILELDNVRDQNLSRKVESLFRQISNLFDKMKQYNGTNRGDVISSLEGVIRNSQSNTNYDGCLDVLYMIAYQKGLKQNLNIDSKLKEIENIKKQILKYEQDAKKALESIQNNANKVGVSKYSSIFDKQADIHNKAASKWFGGIIILLIVVVVCSFSLLFGWFNPPNDASWGIIVQFTTAKLIIFSALCIAISWAIKSYKANKHNEVLNKHRQNALEIFETFVNGTSDEQTKNAVLLQAVQSIFAQQNTGYNDNETETGNAQTKILEFVSSSIKNNAK